VKSGLPSRRLRVLHVIESMGRGGAERNFVTLLPALTSLGIENVLATLWGGHAFDVQLDRVAVERHDFGLARPGPAFTAVPGLVRLARTVDLVHTQLPWADITGRLAALLAGRPSLTTLHTTQYDPENTARLPQPMQTNVALIQLMDATLATTTRRFFAVSPAVRDSYVRALRLSPEAIEIAPCVLDPEAFDPGRQPPRELLRSQYGMAPDQIAAVSVGRLIPSKRQADAIAAVAQAARAAPVHLYLVGTGPDEPALRRLAAERSAPVTFLGDRGDVPQLLHAADLFLFPTLFEGMPMALLEAMAMGKPCLCSDLVEIRQLGGDALRYFPPQDVPSLLRGLGALIADAPLRGELGRRARETARRFADPPAAASRFVSAARGLLAPGDEL
jgi:glycosyltransferase involved in cell wall biosynthesis